MTKKKEAVPAQAHQGDCLSWGDSFFLYLEREGQPLSIASISEFEGDIALQECIDSIATKLSLIPRYRQHVVFPPFNVGLPVWEFDPKFDLKNHIREVKLRKGTDAEFKAACGKILSTSLDRSRPLWDFTLFRGLKGDRTGLVVRVHHCLADGIAGVRLVNVLLGADVVPLPGAKKEEFKPPAPTDSGTLLVDGLFRSYFSVVERFLKVQAEVLQAARQVMSHSANSEESGGASPKPSPRFVDLMTELVSPAERLPFNRVCQGPHNIAWTEIPLPEIKAVKDAHRTTVNNVMLTVLTSAIARYSLLHGVKPRGRRLRVVVPVNVRGDGNPDNLGNQITFLPISVPMDIRDSHKLLDAVHAKMENYKHARIAELVSLAGTLAGAIPTMLQAIAAPIASQLPLSVCNTIITNVPGPQTPLYLVGHKMLRWFPVVPIGGEMGMNIAILSYNGVVYFGFHGDVKAVPDVEIMEELVQSSFAELYEPIKAKIPSQPAVKSIARKRTAKKAAPRRTARRKSVVQASGKKSPSENPAIEESAAEEEKTLATAGD